MQKLLEINAWDKLEIMLIPNSVEEEVAQNVLTILKTMRGSVPFDREFGINPQLIDQPIGLVKAKLTADIVEAVAKFEKRARVQEVQFKADLNGRLEPTVRIVIRE